MSPESFWKFTEYTSSGNFISRIFSFLQFQIFTKPSVELEINKFLEGKQEKSEIFFLFFSSSFSSSFSFSFFSSFFFLGLRIFEIYFLFFSSIFFIGPGKSGIFFSIFLSFFLGKSGIFFSCSIWNSYLMKQISCISSSYLNSCMSPELNPSITTSLFSMI